MEKKLHLRFNLSSKLGQFVVVIAITQSLLFECFLLGAYTRRNGYRSASYLLCCKNVGQQFQFKHSHFRWSCSHRLVVVFFFFFGIVYFLMDVEKSVLFAICGHFWNTMFLLRQSLSNMVRTWNLWTRKIALSSKECVTFINGCQFKISQFHIHIMYFDYNRKHLLLASSELYYRCYIRYSSKRTNVNRTSNQKPTANTKI